MTWLKIHEAISQSIDCVCHWKFQYSRYIIQSELFWRPVESIDGDKVKISLNSEVQPVVFSGDSEQIVMQMPIKPQLVLFCTS